jgi:signal transduction histidine kinase
MFHRTRLHVRAGAVLTPLRLLMILPATAAVVLVAFSVSRVSATTELLLLLAALGTLVLGHALLRSRARRLEAEAEARRARAELALQARVGDCEQRRRDLSGFARMAAHVAHEVRNPLGAIALNTELLSDELGRGAARTAEAHALLSSIARETERLRNLTEAYLAFARPPGPTPVRQPLNQMLRDVAMLVREQAARQAVEIDLDLDPHLAPAFVDPDQIRQALLNLIRNALQSMPSGGRLTLSTRSAVGALRLTVADTGRGIPAHLRCQIFEPFFTTKADGTGLGLPFALHVARAHGGDLEVESREGATRFTMTLPSAAGDGLAAAGRSLARPWLLSEVGA